MNINFPAADFTPQLSGYTGQGAFRFWCQKALPIVYDDSLSYYELLNKVVVYLNNVIADVSTVEDNVEKIDESFVSLQEYVNEHIQEISDIVSEYTDFTKHYFDNLDVQNEINTKLDKMAEDGSLSFLIGPLVANEAPEVITQWLNEHITPTSPVVDDTLSISGAAADAKVTGDEIGDIRTAVDGIFIARTVISPYTVGTENLMRAIIDGNGYVVSGTRNKANLYPMKQGTYAVNGLIIVVRNNTVTVNGTANATTYFSLKDGVAKTAQEIAAEEFDMPPGNWYFSFGYLAGYEIPIAIQCRKKDNTSLVLQTTDPPLYDSATWGGLMIYVPNGQTWNRGATLCVTRERETGDVQQQISRRVEWINRTKFFNVAEYDYIISGGSSVIQSLTIETEKTKKNYVRYSTRAVPNAFAQEVLDIYVPMQMGYVDYIMVHSVNGEQRAGGGNVWRLAQIVKVNDEFEQEYFITATGESEMALMIQGRDDFIGGVTHGDEWINEGSFTVILNGNVVDLNTIDALTEFTNLTLIATNNMYDPSSHTSLVGYHGLEWVFTSDGLDLRQAIKFNGNYTMNECYSPMVIAIRNSYSTQTIQITDRYIDDGDFTKYNISTEGFTTYPNRNKKDVKLVYMLGSAKDVEFRVEYIEQPSELNGSGNYLYNGAAYNKLYNMICGYNSVPQDVDENTKWKTRAKIMVIANK